MCSVQYLREFIKERLTAACEEIFSEVQKTIVRYEEEIVRQRKLLDISRRPDRNSHIIEFSQQHEGEEEEGLTDLPVCNQERNSSLDQEDPEPPQIKDEQEDPEPPQIKEEEEELCNSQEGEQLGLKQETDTFMVTLTYEESDHSEPESNSEQLISHSSHETELKKRRHHRKRSHSQRVNSTPVSECQRQTDARKKSLKCDTCGKAFIYKSHLVTHLRVHTGEKPHCCITCGKRFGQKSDLERHARIHTGEKPFSCSACGKRFIEKSGLDRHVRIHTGEKPYLCSTCGKRFTWLIQFKTHMRIHTE